MLQRLTNNIPRFGVSPFAIMVLLLFGAERSFGQIPTVTADWTNVNCGGPQGTITPTGSGGTPPYVIQVFVAATGVLVPPPTTGSTYSGLAAGQYAVTISDAAGKGSFVMVTVGTGCITFTVDVGTATCGAANGSMTVNQTGGIGAMQYSIDGGTTWQASNSFPNILGGVYSVEVKDAQNTVAAQPITVGSINGPTLTAYGSDASCNNNDGSVVADARGGTIPLTFSLDNGTFGSSPIFTKVASGSHVVQVQDANGCSVRFPVTVNLINSLTVAMPANPTICEGTSTPLAASSPNGVSFQWVPATGLNNASVLNPVASPTVTTDYTLTATWGACTKTGNLTVNVNPAPDAVAGPADTTCYGKSVQLSGSGTGGTGAYSYKWTPKLNLNNPALPNPTVQRPMATATYGLVVTDANGCNSLNSASTTVNVLPPPPISAGNDTNVVAGQPVPLQASDLAGSGFVSYAWTPPGGLTDPTIANPVLSAATETETFTVTGTTALGCQGVASVTVKVFAAADIFVPNAFTPNHDGHNDLFRVVASSIKELKVFAVYDRQGAMVFQTKNPAEGWDGTRNGREMPAGVYVWFAQGVDWQGKPVERKGTVVLVR